MTVENELRVQPGSSPVPVLFSSQCYLRERKLSGFNTGAAETSSRSDEMKVSFFCIGIGNGASADAIREIATNAERLGFSGIWAPEHVVLFDRQLSRYPYDPEGLLPLPKDIDFNDPFIGLTYAAAVTSRIRLATGICLVPERNPVFLAKEIATLDRLSGGRVALGIGIGWSAEEFSAAGVPFEHRARRTREYIELMRRFWNEDRVTFNGEFTRVENARSFPKPVSGAKVPILVGGESDAALKRAVYYGTGWFGLGLRPDEVAAKVKQLHQFARANNRDPEELEDNYRSLQQTHHAG